MKALLDLFRNNTQQEEFDAIRLRLLLLKKLDHGHMVKLRSQKLLIIELLNLREMDFFAQKYLVQ